MGWKLLLCLFVGLASSAVTNNSAWRSGAKYVYNVQSNTLTRHHKNYCTGIVMTAKLTVTPKSENALMAMISDVQYARFENKNPEECKSENIGNHHKLSFKPLQLAQQPFRINMENGVIKSINIYENLETYKINMLRGVISEIQFDMQGENLIQAPRNQHPGNTFAGVFKTMEETVTGSYATLYEFKELPHVVTQDRPWLVSYPQLKGKDGFTIEVLKTKDYSQSKERVGYNYGLGNKDNWEPFSSSVGNVFSRTGVTRAVITGNPNHYTIQSAVTHDIIAVSPLHNSEEKYTVVSSNNLTLLNFEPRAPQLQEPSSSKSFLHRLTYQYNNQDHTKQQEMQQHNQHRNSRNDDNEYDQTQNSPQSFYADYSSNEFDSMSSEHKWQQEKAELQHAPKSPLLPYTTGYMGQFIKNNKQIDIIQTVKTLANNIAKYLQNPELNNQQDDAFGNYLTLTALIRTMDKAQIETAIKALYSQEENTFNGYSWKACRDSLAEAGTGPALLTLQNLILENKIPEYAASIVVEQITNSVRQPTEEFMKSLFQFTKNPEVLAKPHLKYRIISGYANLVRKVYVNQKYTHAQYPEHSFGRFSTPSGIKFVSNVYVPYLQQRLDEAISQNDYHNAQIYITALGYVADRSILKVFRPYFNGSKYATPFQRLQMVVSLGTLATYNPKLVQYPLFRIYQNLGEQEDVRVASVFLLVKTEPSAYIFQRMALYMKIDHSAQVNSAVESSIRTIARLVGPEFNKVRRNAQSALHLLFGKSYPMQYSRQYMRNYFVPEMYLAFKQILTTIHAADSLVPKAFQYLVESNIGGVKSKEFNAGYMVSSVDQLIHALFRQTKTYHDYHNEKNKKPSKNQWSSENIFRVLNVQREKPEHLDGRFFFEIGGMESSFAFNDQDIEWLPQVVQQMEQQLRNKNNFHLTKFINSQDMAVSVVTVTGFPSIYTFDSPTLIHLDGKGSVVSEPHISSEGTLHVPKKINVDGEIHMMVQNQRQGQLGFFTPFENRHYLAGYQRNVQFQVSLNARIDGNFEKGQYTVEIKPVHLQKNQQLLQFNSIPYISVRDISNFQPIVTGHNTLIIKEHKPHSYKYVIGQETTGIALQAQFEGDEQLNWAWLYQHVERHDPISALMAPWYDDSVYYAKLNVAFSAQHSSNDRIQAQITYRKSDHYENCPNSGAIDISELYKISANYESRPNQFYQKACSGISDAKVQVVDLHVKAMGKEEISYAATVAVATSHVDEKSHFLFYAGRHPANHHKTTPYKVVAYAKAQFPKINGLDPMFALQEDYNANVQGQLAFGEAEKPSSEINMQATFSKSKQSKKQLQHDPLMHQCKKETQEGNYQLPACQELHLKANTIDHISVKLQHQRVEKEFQNVAVKFLDRLKYSFNKHFGHNFANPAESGPNEIFFDAQFYDDNQKVNIDIQTEKSNMQFKNMDIPDFVQPFVNVHPIYSVQNRMFGYAYSSSYQIPFCVIDQTYANTLDNLTYPLNLGKDWTVALLYAPSYANADMPRSNRQQNHQYNEFQSQQQHGAQYQEEYQQHQQLQQQQGHSQYQQQGQNQQAHNQQWQSEQAQNQQGQEENGQSQYKFLGWRNQGNHQQEHSQGQFQEQYQRYQNVKHNGDKQIEYYAVLVRDGKGRQNNKEVKVTLRSPHTNYEFMEIDMVPSGNSKLRADILVNNKKQKINPQHGLNLNDYINVHVRPNGEVGFVVDGVFHIMYDGQRFRLTILDNNKFRNDIRGLCGTFTGNHRSDFTCPQNCIFRDHVQFVESYRLNGKNQHDQHQCSFQEVIYADVISDQDVGLNNRDHRNPTSSSSGCSRLQTRYFHDVDGKVCFTVKMHPVCKPHCKCTKQSSKTVGVFCVNKGKNTDLWIKEIQKGGSPDFSDQTPTKYVPINVDQSCSPRS